MYLNSFEFKIDFYKNDRKDSECYTLSIYDSCQHLSPVNIRLTEAKAKKMKEEAETFLRNHSSPKRDSVVEAFPNITGIKMYYGKGCKDYFILPEKEISELVKAIEAQF